MTAHRSGTQGQKARLSLRGAIWGRRRCTRYVLFYSLEFRAISNR
jgi:hypothetical protein